MKTTLFTLLMLLLCSCSAEQAYYGAQGIERSQCANGPANDYQACLERNNMSYEEYELRREQENSENL